MSMTLPSVRYEDGVADHCVSMDLNAALETATEIVARAFPDALALTVSLAPIFDSPGVWVVIEARVEGTVEDAHRRNRECSHELARALGPETASHFITTYFTVPECGAEAGAVAGVRRRKVVC